MAEWALPGSEELIVPFPPHYFLPAHKQNQKVELEETKQQNKKGMHGWVV
jgi:hypothetical protein